MDSKCLKSGERPALFDASRIAEPVRHDIYLRAMRLRLLEGELLPVLRDLAPQLGADGACRGAMAWCRRFLVDAMRLPGADGAEALAIYLDMPGRDRGPFAGELARLAAIQAEAAGAPIYAANMLAALTGTIPEADQPAHLRRIAGLFVAGGDRARAEEILQFARSRLDRATWKRDGWEALQRALRRPVPPRPTETIDPDIQSARTTVEAARLIQVSRGARP
jgi:hypothetical protein